MPNEIFPSASTSVQNEPGMTIPNTNIDLYPGQLGAMYEELYNKESFQRFLDDINAVSADSVKNGGPEIAPSYRKALKELMQTYDDPGPDNVNLRDKLMLMYQQVGGFRKEVEGPGQHMKYAHYVIGKVCGLALNYDAWLGLDELNDHAPTAQTESVSTAQHSINENSSISGQNEPGMTIPNTNPKLYPKYLGARVPEFYSREAFQRFLDDINAVSADSVKNGGPEIAPCYRNALGELMQTFDNPGPNNINISDKLYEISSQNSYFTNEVQGPGQHMEYARNIIGTVCGIARLYQCEFDADISFAAQNDNAPTAQAESVSTAQHNVNGNANALGQNEPDVKLNYNIWPRGGDFELEKFSKNGFQAMLDDLNAVSAKSVMKGGPEIVPEFRKLLGDVVQAYDNSGQNKAKLFEAYKALEDHTDDLTFDTSPGDEMEYARKAASSVFGFISTARGFGYGEPEFADTNDEIMDNLIAEASSKKVNTPQEPARSISDPNKIAPDSNKIAPEPKKIAPEPAKNAMADDARKRVSFAELQAKPSTGTASKGEELLRNIRNGLKKTPVKATAEKTNKNEDFLKNIKANLKKVPEGQRRRVSLMDEENRSRGIQRQSANNGRLAGSRNLAAPKKQGRAIA